MKKIAVIGHFAKGKEYLDGQTVKTKILTQTLCDHYGEKALLKLDTHGWKKHPIRFLLRVWKAAKHAQHVIILPAHNGVRVLVPVLHFATLLGKRCKAHYAVIGGWLPKYLSARPGLANMLKRFAGIYVETSTMKKSLDDMGFSNVEVMPNSKFLKRLTEDQLVHAAEEPYKLCTFSRIMKEKGIEDAVNAVRAVNEALGRTVYTLDIYGQIDSTQTQWFEKLRDAFPEYVRYGGLVPYDKSVEVLKDSFALLFPTRFFTEGIPGTIIDAYAAGVPVISAKWESFGDVIAEGVTGYGYAFEDVDGLRQQLFLIAEMPERITNLRMNCLKHAVAYTPNKAMDVLIKRIGG